MYTSVRSVMLSQMEEMAKLMEQLAISGGDNKKLGQLNKAYDDDEKQGYGNNMNEEPDKDDKHVVIVSGATKISAPTSIQWKLGAYQIDWGLRGSFCGIGIGRKRFVKPETGDYKVLFHFGFIFNGNDYTLTEPAFGTEFPDRHWLLLHLCDTDQIGVELCGSKSTTCSRLSQVWADQGEIDKKDYKYIRLQPGFCRTSVQCIGGAVNNEKTKKYELCYSDNVKWTDLKDLSEYTNCMLFVIRLCKLCKMEIPSWKQIVALFDKWEGSNRWEPHWTHFKQYATVKWQ